MEKGIPPLEDLYSKLTLEEEDEGGIIIREEEKAGQGNDTYVLIGHF